MQTNYAGQIQNGTDVFSRDGEKIGSVSGVADQYFVIEKGFIFTTDLYVPMSAIERIDEDGIDLSMTKEEIDNNDWSQAPAEGSYDTDQSYASGTSGMTDTTYAAGTGTDYEAGTGTGTEYGTGTTGATDSDTIERREERLVVDKQAEQAGTVHVGKRVEEQVQAVDVPVTREEVTLDRHAVDRPATGDTFTEDSIDVPVYEERVEASKEARVVEELEVGKTQVSDTQRVEDTVRREEFDIDDTGTSRENR